MATITAPATAALIREPPGRTLSHCGGCGAYQAPTPLQPRRDMLGALRLLAESQVMGLLAAGDTVVDEDDEEDDDSVEQPPAAPSSAARRSTFLLDDDDTGAIPVAPSASRAS